MKTDKILDSVKMMREIRAKINADIIKMSPEEIVDYIKKWSKRL